MIPLINTTAPVQTPPAVVNTAVAPASNTPVAATAVAPSFSIVPADNNARGNSATGAGSPAAAPAPALISTPTTPTASTLPANQLTLGSTSFLAQLIGQDVSNSAKTVLVEYEKLVYLSTVKYKPSDALKPESQPGDLFSKLVTEQKAQASSQILSGAQISSNESASVATLAAAASPSPARNAGRPTPTAAQEQQAEEDAIHAILESIPVQAQQPVPAALSAYLSSASRVNVQALSNEAIDIA